jgi:LPXTG-motif cell wall-anchored protein
MWVTRSPERDVVLPAGDFMDQMDAGGRRAAARRGPRPTGWIAGVGAVVLLSLAGPAPAFADPVTTQVDGTTVVTFPYTGAVQDWVVPAGVTVIAIDIAGAQGGSSNSVGGLGAELVGTVAVTPGQTLHVLVGGRGGDGTRYGTGAGGGGGSFVYTAATTAGLVAAAGGGGGSASNGGAGNASTGPDGGDGEVSGAGLGGTGGGGGAGSAAGGGGGLLGDGGGIGSVTGGSTLANGGAGGDPGTFQPGGAGGFGGGGAGGANNIPGYAGGGGGGYSGGGSGAFDGIAAGGGGGGGSLFAGTLANQSVGRTGDGSVTFRYPLPTTTTVSASPDPGTTGKSTTLTATVAAVIGSTDPTGTVTFRDGATALGTGTVDHGTATLTLTLSLGVHHLTAAYSGDVALAPSTSDAVTYTVVAPRPELAATGVNGPAGSVAVGVGALLVGLLLLLSRRRRTV